MLIWEHSTDIGGWVAVTCRDSPRLGYVFFPRLALLEGRVISQENFLILQVLKWWLYDRLGIVHVT